MRKLILGVAIAMLLIPAEMRAQAMEQEPVVEQEPKEIHHQTATGETIIDRRKQRDTKKIYEEEEGEYVEFSEE